MKELVLNGLYQHYKGMLYKVISIVRHSETLEELVYYECQYENELGKQWVRPKKMFEEQILINGELRPRFKYIGNQKGKSQIP